MTTEELARRIEETAVGPFAILLGLTEEHFTELVAARKKIADALRFHEAAHGNNQPHRWNGKIPPEDARD